MRSALLKALVAAACLLGGLPNAAAEHATTWLDELQATSVPQDDPIEMKPSSLGISDCNDGSGERLHENVTEFTVHSRSLQTVTTTSTLCSYPAVRASC